MCKHEFKEYVGFTNSFEYCVKCDAKKADCDKVDSIATRPLTNHITPIYKELQKRTGYTEVKNDTPPLGGFSAWLPDNKPEDINSGMALKTFSYTLPWYTITNLGHSWYSGPDWKAVQENINEIICKVDNYNISTDAFIYGPLFGLDRSVEPHRYGDWPEPSEPYEEIVEITKREFYEAFTEARNEAQGSIYFADILAKKLGLE